MSKLVSANFSRLFRNKFFWICLVLTVGVAAAIAIDFRMSYSWSPQYISHQTGDACVMYAPILAGIVALFVSLFVGEEYGNKTIRNKIASGYSKGKVYVANLLVCMFVGSLFYWLFFMIIALPIAPWKELVKYNGNIVTDILRDAEMNYFAVLAVISIAVFISMLVKNRIMGVVVTVVCMLLLFLAAEFMMEGIRVQEFIWKSYEGSSVRARNPEYTGSVRDITLQTIMNVQPFGQMLQVYRGDVEDIRAFMFPVYSCLMAVLFGFGGVYLFSKKDLE